MAAYVQDIFMLFGDSITQGSWAPGDTGIGQRLSHVYARKLDVLNRGFSGYNTDWALPVFKQCLAKKDEAANGPKVRVLTIWFGANDACIKPSPQHVPLNKFKANLREMVDLVHSPNSPYYAPHTRIILITPPPVNTHTRKADLESRDPPVELDRLFDVTKEYASAVMEIAREKNVAVVDAWTPLWKGAGEGEKALSKYLPDGLHLNEAGYKVVYEALIKVIAEKYPDVHYEQLGFAFAPWKDIKWESPEESLQVQRANVGA
ncbi:GDSL Lipase/Acylhydrolase [Coprinopsis cinerea okayama7|uniref:GDSL Lipase/Acylhydrolase n=1 Tax=Coprinopsis cinerea (strain Okayama-7 / 130 / ATCC MYA-4618 / FGSC 9003) TaxID=240176 RepID=A8NH67_COPC7|nr:GDSL Lipase/Acylhydrolase [Coprinopsis cinerea okayama7\|eukprot:XP_001833695.2 GDSL Lipase/Acylhydrolase [Coprinopsis cinerea okayama7\